MKARLWTRSYTSIIIVNILMTMAFSMFSGLIPLYVRDLGGDNRIVGSMAAGFSILMMLSKPLTGALMDRTDRRRFLLISTALFSLNVSAYGLKGNLALLYFLRLCSGLTNGLYIVSSSAMISLVVKDRRLEDAISYYRITASLSSAASPAIGTFLYRSRGFPALFAVMAVFAVSGFILMNLVDRNDVPDVKVTEPFSVRTTLHPRNLVESSALPACGVVLFLYIATSSTKDYLIAYGETAGVPNISLFFLTNSIFMLLSRLVHRLAGNRISENMRISAGAAVLAGVYFLVPQIRTTFAAVLAGAVYGLADGLVTPLLNAIALRRAPLRRKGTASATFSMVNGIGTGIGGDLWGRMSAAYGYPPIYYGASAFALIGSAATWVFLRPSRRSRQEEAGK